MQLGALVADANGRTRCWRCGLPPTWLSATVCGLEYARSRLSGQGTGDECQPSMLWDVREPTSHRDHLHYISRVILQLQTRGSWDMWPPIKCWSAENILF